MNGTFDFYHAAVAWGGNLFRGGRIRWAVQYMDAKNATICSNSDKKYLWSKVIIAGKTYEREKHEHGLSDKEKSYTIQIEAAPERLVHRLQNGDNWLVLDTWTEQGRDFTQGKFGFLVQGSDEIGLSDFKFTSEISHGGGRRAHGECSAAILAARSRQWALRGCADEVVIRFSLALRAKCTTAIGGGNRWR